MTQYIVDTEDAEAVKEELQDAAEDAGWEEMAEWEVTVPGYEIGVALERDNEFMGIHASAENGQTLATVITGPLEENDDNGNDATNGNDVEQPPTEDVDGEDLEDVPRYPESVLTSYSTWEWTENDEEYLGANLDYLAEEDAETIADWYETELPDYGWTIYGTGEEDGEHYIWAEDEPFVLGVTIESSDDYDGYSEIQIEYGDFAF